MKRLVLTAVVASLALAGVAWTHAAWADAAKDAAKDAARTAIWAKEQAIYAGRAKGDLGPYLSNTAPEFLAWPPYSPAPYGAQTMQGMESGWKDLNQEKLTMEFKDFTLRGDTALIYYLNHRTMLPDGKPVDQNWEIIHVWVLDHGDWKCLGGMQRLAGAAR
jgi:ketosteroid isomerase-like protein